MTLHTKLLEIQKKLLKFGKDGDNPFFKSKYLTLDHLLEVLLPVLNEFDILVYHITKDWNVETHVTDGTDDIVSSFPITNLTDPQKVGSIISYGRRYNLGQIFNIVTDVDDDGNKASVPDQAAGKENYTKKHIDALAKNMKNFPWTYTMTVEELIADKEKNFYVSDAMKDSIKELYNRLPKKETPEEVGTSVDEAFKRDEKEEEARNKIGQV